MFCCCFCFIAVPAPSSLRVPNKFLKEKVENKDEAKYLDKIVEIDLGKWRN